MANADKRTNLPGGRSKPKKPLTVGKGTGYTRPVTPGSKPRPVSAKPSQAGLVRSAQKTTSSGITQRPNGRAQGEGRSGRQSISRATVTSASNGKPTGGSARVTTGRGGMGKPTGRGIGPAAVAYETLKARPTADGTLTAAMKRGDYKPRQGPNVPKRLTQGGMDKGSFNSAFKASRTAGKKTFTWRGKKYTTEMK
jgi:hypothetical protein